MSKRIALFIDGTWNEATSGVRDTNVRRFFESAVYQDGEQLTYYIPGVGMDIRGSRSGDPKNKYRVVPDIQVHGKASGIELRWYLRKIYHGSTGGGTGERIREAYAFLSREYVRGDQVFIFGFSRGAYAARSLINFIENVGLLLKDKLEYVELAYRLYEKGPSAVDFKKFEAYLRNLGITRTIQSNDDSFALPVHFIGVWDSVGAIGRPLFANRFVAARTEILADYMPRGATVRHAVALHELREMFAPLLWLGHAHTNRFQQVGFPGAHADIGGGYDFETDGKSAEAMMWMYGEAEAAGLTFREENHAVHRANKTAKERHLMHTGLEGIFTAVNAVAREDVINVLSVDSATSRLDLHKSVENHLNISENERYDSDVGESALTQLAKVDGQLILFKGSCVESIEPLYTPPPPPPPPRPPTPSRRPAPSSELGKLYKMLMTTSSNSGLNINSFPKNPERLALQEFRDKAKEIFDQTSKTETDKSALYKLQWVHDMLGECCWSQLVNVLDKNEIDGIDTFLCDVRDILAPKTRATKRLTGMKGVLPWKLLRFWHEANDYSGTDSSRQDAIKDYFLRCKNEIDKIVNGSQHLSEDEKSQVWLFLTTWGVGIQVLSNKDIQSQCLRMFNEWAKQVLPVISPKQ